MMRSRNLVFGLAVAALLAIAPLPCSAVIVIGSQERNTTPPSDPGMNTAWNLEGEWAVNYLGTPIAPSYFITANHIGGSISETFNFQGQNYTIDPSFANSGHYNIPFTDLAIWKINGTMPTYAPLYNGTDEIGKPMLVFGRGTQRGAEVRDGSNVLHGWRVGGADPVKSWGTNTVSGVFSIPLVGDQLAYGFDFAGGANEGALSGGDSAGGVFIQQGGVWKLAGINYGVDGPYSTSSTGANAFDAALFNEQGFYEDQGAYVLNTTNSTSTSYSTRISSYASQIAAIVPEPSGASLLTLCAGWMIGRRRRK